MGLIFNSFILGILLISSCTCRNLVQSEKNDMLREVNRLRNTVASGTYVGRQSAAAMNVLAYSEPLANRAASCASRHPSSSQICGANADHGILIYTRNGVITNSANAQVVVQSWMSNLVSGNQLLVGRETQIGCAYEAQPSSNIEQVVCYFDKPVKAGVDVYTTGPSGAACTVRTSAYPLLCQVAGHSNLIHKGHKLSGQSKHKTHKNHKNHKNHEEKHQSNFVEADQWFETHQAETLNSIDFM